MAAVAKKLAAMQAPDAEDENEPPETPGEAPDAEDAAEAPETNTEGEDASNGRPPPNVSPEEQAMYETVVIAAQSMIYGKGTGDLLKQRVMQSKGDPKELGHIAAMIAQSIQGGAQKQGKDIPTDVLFAAGQEIVADIVELAVAGGLVKKEDEEEVFKKTLFEGLRFYGNAKMASGQVSMDDRKQAAQQLLDLHQEVGPDAKLGDVADKMMGAGGQAAPDEQQPPEGA